MEILVGAVIGLIILIILVALHELGHALAAIKSGVVVQEFAIGFPPRAWAKKLKNGIVFSLNWLPLGGFVKFQGEYDAADQKGDYGAAGYLQKTGILLAGVAVNWVVAALLLTILAWTAGIPKILPDQFYVQSDATVTSYPVEVTNVIEDSPASGAGLRAGDFVLSLDGTEINSTSELVQAARERGGKTVQVVYERDGGRKSVDVALNDDVSASTEGYLGTALGQRQGMIRSGWSAPITGIVTTAQFSWETLIGVKNLAVSSAQGAAQRISPDADTREEGKENLGEVANSVAGPIGMLGVIFPAATQGGLANLLFLTAIISLTLAVMNILPIPALDGGRWVTMTAFRLLRRPLTKEREEMIQGTGFVTLLALIVLITFTDIGKLL